MSLTTLTDEQVRRARALWEQDKTLGEIAKTIGCTVSDLSPWLYRDDIRRAPREELTSEDQR